ncbi:MAG: NAD-dependent malic enzyme [Chloroflexaceae bacterium]|nr:NAD-dependent malic enzyme [Chloroflexaceae bacterium]
MSKGVAYTITLRCQIQNKPGMLGKLATVIGDTGGNIGAVDAVRIEGDGALLVRDITVQVQDEQHGEQIITEINRIAGIAVLHTSDRVFLSHLGGKLAIQSRVPLKTRDDLSLAYTPGVARICRAIADDPEAVYTLTIKRNNVAIVSDGSAILGLGNLGAAAALPVMEGKAILLKEFADIDAYPICLQSQDPDVIVATVEQIAPVFGCINLEDIAAPKCFDVEERLIEALDIPVMHDDQHGTAVVVLAALRNALALVDKHIGDIRVVLNGAGAAGTAIIKTLHQASVGEITACDSKGIIAINDDRGPLPPAKQLIADMTNREGRRGSLTDALQGADVFIGVSVGNLLTPEMLQQMGNDAIVFALANPVPEGDPEWLVHYARVVATGRSDYANQINNALSFPGIYRGALDARAERITPGMLLAAAEALANVIAPAEISEDYIIPSVFNRSVVPAIASALAHEAVQSGVARRSL